MRSRTNLDENGNPERGREAEELRKGIENLISAADASYENPEPFVLTSDLKALLEDVDARDSLGHVTVIDRATLDNQSSDPGDMLKCFLGNFAENMQAIESVISSGSQTSPQLSAESQQAQEEPDEDEEWELDGLVETLREGLQPLVRDGLISEQRATERANNMAMALTGVFSFEALDD